MVKVQKFNNDLFQLEVQLENGESLFDVESVARSLGITKTETKNGKNILVSVGNVLRVIFAHLWAKALEAGIS